MTTPKDCVACLQIGVILFPKSGNQAGGDLETVNEFWWS